MAKPEFVSLSLIHGDYNEQRRDRRLFLYVVRDPFRASLPEAARAHITSGPAADFYARSDAQVTSAARRLLARFDEPHVFFDEPIDYQLLCKVLTGSLEPEPTVAALRTLPEMEPTLINTGPVWDVYRIQCQQCDPPDLFPNAFVNARLSEESLPRVCRLMADYFFLDTDGPMFWARNWSA